METNKTQTEQLTQDAVMQSVFANELRIGSWINYLGKYVVCSSNTIHAVSKITQPSVMYQAIPLTEEWLLKFGFKKGENGLFYVDICDVYVLELMRIGAVFCAYHTNKNNDNAHSFERIKYVHQLQNLYFVLTQRELTVA